MDPWRRSLPFSDPAGSPPRAWVLEAEVSGGEVRVEARRGRSAPTAAWTADASRFDPRTTLEMLLRELRRIEAPEPPWSEAEALLREAWRRGRMCALRQAVLSSGLSTDDARSVFDSLLVEGVMSS